MQRITEVQVKLTAKDAKFTALKPRSTCRGRVPASVDALRRLQAAQRSQYLAGDIASSKQS